MRHVKCKLCGEWYGDEPQKRHVCGAESVKVKADRLIRAVYLWCAMGAARQRFAADVVDITKARGRGPDFAWGFISETAQAAREWPLRFDLQGNRTYTCPGCGCAASREEPTCRSCREPLRAGDRVLHEITGETWRLLTDEQRDGSVYPGGWPPTRANAADCRLIKAATDAERRAALESVIASGGHLTFTARHDLNRERE